MSQYFLPKLSDICREADKQLKQDNNALSDILVKLKLTQDEEGLLVRMFPPNLDNIDQAMERYEKWIKVARDSDTKDSFLPLTENEINKVIFTKEKLQEEIFLGSIIRAILTWKSSGEIPAARELISKLELFSAGYFVFEELDDPYDSIYFRLSVWLINSYLPHLTRRMQIFYFQSQCLLTAVLLDLDIEKAARLAIEDYPIIKIRKEISLELALALCINGTSIGGRIDNNDFATIGYWIDEFRKYSKKEFDGISFINFFKDERFWINTSENELVIVRKLLSLYINLVGEKYVFSDVEDELERATITKEGTKKQTKKTINDNEVKKISIADIKEKIIAKRKDVSEEEVIEKLKQMSANYQDPNIADYYYFDESQGKFVWKE